MISKEDIYDARLFIIDDNATNVELLQKIVSNAGYNSVLAITDPREAKSLYETYKPDLVLLDINMPFLDGFQVMEQFKEVEKGSYIPVLVLTALQDEKTRLKALSAGAKDFLTKPFSKIEILTRIRNMITVRLLHNEVKHQNLILEKKVQERTLELEHTRLQIIQRLGQAAEYRDTETGEHVIRMSKMCALLASLAGMSEEKTKLILNASPMHDVGKIGIPDSILLKKGKLTSAEWETMKSHTTIGASLLDGHDSDLIVLARDVALTHHEKWDGSGYPNALRGEEILLEGRIAGLIDVFDALSSKRPYKPPYPLEKALSVIKQEKGKHFDPDLVDLFLDNFDLFVKVKNEFSSEEDMPSDNYELSERDRDDKFFDKVFSNK